MINPAKRASRSETRRPGSPFRSNDEGLRADKAVDYILQREAEIMALEIRLSKAQRPGHKRVLALRLQATRASLTSWSDYLNNDAPREARAVMIPRKRALRDQANQLEQTA